MTSCLCLLLILFKNLITSRPFGKKKRRKNENKSQSILQGSVCSSAVVWLCCRTAAIPWSDHQGALRVDWACGMLGSLAFTSLNGPNGQMSLCHRKHSPAEQNYLRDCCFWLADNCESAVVVCWWQNEWCVPVLPLLHLLSYFGSSTLGIRLWICVSEQKSHSRLWDYAHTLNLFFCRDSSLIFGAIQRLFHRYSRCSVFSAWLCLQGLPAYDMFLPSKSSSSNTRETYSISLLCRLEFLYFPHLISTWKMDVAAKECISTDPESLLN